jgi:hypothetical protein
MCNHVAYVSWPEGLQVLASGIETLYIPGVVGLENKHNTEVNSLSNASSHLTLLLAIQEVDACIYNHSLQTTRLECIFSQRERISSICINEHILHHIASLVTVSQFCA